LKLIKHYLIKYGTSNIVHISGAQPYEPRAT